MRHHVKFQRKLTWVSCFIEIPIKTREILKTKFISYLRVNLHSSILTDYLLLYLLAITAFIYCCSGGESSLSSAIQAFK